MGPGPRVRLKLSFRVWARIMWARIELYFACALKAGSRTGIASRFGSGPLGTMHTTDVRPDICSSSDADSACCAQVETALESVCQRP